MVWLFKKESLPFKTLPNYGEILKDYHTFIDNVKKKFDKADLEVLKKAFIFCVEGHKNKVRKSGDPYYRHPLAVAYIVMEEIPLDQTSIICALLHDIPKFSETYGLADIKSEFGQTVAEIVDGISKIQHIETQNIEIQENYRKLLLSLFKDIRIILIKIAEMLHNMRTIKYLSEEEQIKIAKESLEIYAPFAHRFGLANLKWELEDDAFRIINPKEYNRIKNNVQLTHIEREEYIKSFIEEVKKMLNDNVLFQKNKIKFEIYGRAKSIYSIYNKEFARQMSMDKFNDLIAIRIIIDSDEVSYCYLTYGIITGFYPIIPNSFKNYIANPKKNGYQSLHIAVKGPGNNPIEVQIRTKKMHEIAEKGVAAHFNYKRGLLPAHSIFDQENIENWLELIKEVFEKSKISFEDELLEKLKKQWLFDEIYVFTPDKSFKVFPKDSTPIDFAYSIHEDIGNGCIGAKVNGNIVPLNYKLSTGDQVEIIHSSNQYPKKEWLNWVVTNKAKNSIIRYLNSQKYQEIEKGQQIWRNFLLNNNFQLNDKKFKKLITKMGFKTEEAFYSKLATSELKDTITLEGIKQILWGKNLKIPEDFVENTDNNKSIYDKKIILSKCCYPIRGDKIVGIISLDGKTLMIHRKKCNRLKSMKLQNLSENYSVYKLNWDNIDVNVFEVKLIVKAKERDDLLNDVIDIISNYNEIIVKGFTFETKDEVFSGALFASVPDKTYLDKFIKELKTIDKILSIERYLEAQD